MSEQTPIQKIVGDFTPKIAELTDDVLFGDIWERPELSPRDRSMITVAGLIMGGNTEQLPGHLSRALVNGVTPGEAFYAGWPKALSAVAVVRRVLEV